MRMPRALGCSALIKLPDLQFELLPLAREVPLVGDHELLAGGAILAEWFFIRVDGLQKWREQASNKDSRRIQPSRGDVHGDRTMRQHLSYVHLSPLPRRCGLQLVDASD